MVVALTLMMWNSRVIILRCWMRSTSMNSFSSMRMSIARRTMHQRIWRHLNWAIKITMTFSVAEGQLVQLLYWTRIASERCGRRKQSKDEDVLASIKALKEKVTQSKNADLVRYKAQIIQALEQEIGFHYSQFPPVWSFVRYWWGTSASRKVFGRPIAVQELPQPKVEWRWSLASMPLLQFARWLFMKWALPWHGSLLKSRARLRHALWFLLREILQSRWTQTQWFKCCCSFVRTGFVHRFTHRHFSREGNLCGVEFASSGS